MKDKPQKTFTRNNNKLVLLSRNRVHCFLMPADLLMSESSVAVKQQLQIKAPGSVLLYSYHTRARVVFSLIGYCCHINCTIFSLGRKCGDTRMNILKEAASKMNQWPCEQRTNSVQFRLFVSVENDKTFFRFIAGFSLQLDSDCWISMSVVPMVTSVLPTVIVL